MSQECFFVKVEIFPIDKTWVVNRTDTNVINNCYKSFDKKTAKKLCGN